MLHLVTEQRSGESDLLSAVMHAAFEIRSLSGDVFTTVPAPVSGWTHEQLVAVAVEHKAITRHGVDGYLGGHLRRSRMANFLLKKSFQRFEDGDCSD